MKKKKKKRERKEERDIKYNEKGEMGNVSLTEVTSGGLNDNF